MATTFATPVNAALVPHYHPSWYDSSVEAAVGLLEWAEEVGLLENLDGYYIVENNDFYDEPVYNVFRVEGDEYCGCLHANEEGFDEAYDTLCELLIFYYVNEELDKTIETLNKF